MKHCKGSLPAAEVRPLKDFIKTRRKMEIYIAALLGGVILTILGMIFQKSVKEPINGRGMFRDFLVGLGVVFSIFYVYPDSIKSLHIRLPVMSGGGDSDLELQI